MSQQRTGKGSRGRLRGMAIRGGRGRGRRRWMLRKIRSIENFVNAICWILFEAETKVSVAFGIDSSFFHLPPPDPIRLFLSLISPFIFLPPPTSLLLLYCWYFRKRFISKCLMIYDYRNITETQTGLPTCDLRRVRVGNKQLQLATKTTSRMFILCS